MTTSKVRCEGSGKEAVKQEKFKNLKPITPLREYFATYSGWEKGSVENLVSIVRKILAPMPNVELSGTSRTCRSKVPSILHESQN